MLEVYPDLYLDATLVLPCRRPKFEPFLSSLPGSGKQVIDTLLEGVEKYRGRILYGSDHPAGMGGLSDIYMDLTDLPVSDKTKQSIRSETPVAFVSRFQPGFDWSETLSESEWNTCK